MLTFMLFLHVVGAVGMGIYAILPFIAGRFRNLSTPSQEGLATGLVGAGRIGQFSLVLQLLTGGYLLTGTNVDYATSWMIVVGILFIAIGATTGILQKPLKRVAEASRKGESASDAINRVQTLSVLTFLLFLAILWIMQDPWMAG